MTNLPDALILVESALDRLSAALATGQADAVLAAEEPLANAVQRLSTCPRPTLADRDRVRTGVRAVRLALAQCQRLGRNSAALEQLLTFNSAYGATGVHAHANARGGTLQART